MSRLTRKEELMIVAKDNYKKLNALILKMTGEEKLFIIEPCDWNTYRAMNVEFWKEHHNTLLEESKEMLKQSYSKVLKLAGTGQ